MTQPAMTKRCRWCGRSFEVMVGPGRPREFCKPGCRQADYVARQRSDELGISERELVVTRDALEELRDRLYVLEAALQDVERDLAEAVGEADVRAALDWLMDAARPGVAASGLNLT